MSPRSAAADGSPVSRWLDAVSLDSRLGLRMLVKHRWLTLTGGLAIAVAIAISAFFFEGITALLHSALPLDEGERVVALQYATDNPGNPERRILNDFLAWREEVKSIEQLSAFRTVEQNLVSGDGPPSPVRVAEITSSAFAVARTPPLLGRHLLPSDERAGAPPVLVIGHDAWQSRFGGDRGIVGRSVMLGGAPHVVVGVMPEGFGFPVSHKYWTPLRVNPSAHERLEGPFLYVFGRLAPGFTLEEARAELTAIGQRNAVEDPEKYERLRIIVSPYTQEHAEVDDPLMAWGLWLLQILISGLVVVVGVNLAILNYARTVARVGEISVRSALGASRRRILGQLFIEAAALSVVGAMAGVILAQIALRRVEALVDSFEAMPFWMDLALSPATVLYVAGLAAVAAFVIGVLPGLKVTGGRLHANLRESSGGSGTRLGRTWSLLIIAQVAIAVTALPLAVYVVWEVARIEMADPGFPAERFVSGEVALEDVDSAMHAPEEARRELEARLRARQIELMSRLEGEPGVSAVTFSSSVPGDVTAYRRIELAGAPPVPEAGSRTTGILQVDRGMFETYGAKILAGRGFIDGEAGGAAGPVVVNRTFVEKFLGSHPPLGLQFRYDRPLRGSREPGREGTLWEVVGVVDDFPAFPLEISMEGQPVVYHPASAGEIHPVVIAARFGGDVPVEFPERFREIAVEVDPALQVEAVMPLTETYDRLRSVWRSIAWGLALVTSSVLLLSAAGIYALMSFTVAQRRREIGIRAALGASSRQVLTGIFARVFRQLAVGLAIGSLLSAAFLSITALSFEESTVLLFVVAAIILLIGAIAAVGPARSGLRVAASEALKGDL